MAQHLHLALTLGGYLGGLLVLAGYALTSSGRLRPSSPTAQAVNTTGAILMLANGVVLAAWASVGVNAAWIAIGAAAAWRAHAGRVPAADLAAADLAAADLAAVDLGAADLGAADLPAVPAPRAEAPWWPPTAPLPALGGSSRPPR